MNHYSPPGARPDAGRPATSQAGTDGEQASTYGHGAGVLRASGDGAATVQPIELFFDLVYVLAVTQITQYLLDHLSLRGASETLLLLLVVWVTWIHTVWLSNYFDRRVRPVRLVLLGKMLLSLVMSALLPAAFAQRGLAFAAAVVALQVGGTAILLSTLQRRDPLCVVLERVLCWWAAVGLLWLAGGLVNGDERLALWWLAVLLDYAGIALGFPLPHLGRSHSTDYTITGEHFAERCRQFVILAFGESILVTGADIGELPGSIPTVVAFMTAFVSSVTLWWIYFDQADDAARRVMAKARDPGRLGLSAYTFGHVPIVAGIMLSAAADELTLTHASNIATAASATVILGSPMLFLAGMMIFKWAVWRHLARPRLVAICVLAALGFVAPTTSRLALMSTATLVLLALAVWEYRRQRAGHGRMEVAAR